MKNFIKLAWEVYGLICRINKQKGREMEIWKY